MSIFKNVTTAITFKGTSYQLKKDGPVFSFADLNLETALVSLSKIKKLVRSEISGKDGDVIEYIGKGSSEITITGTITGDFGVEPKERVELLNTVLDAPVAIQVICPFLNSKGIHYVVITDSQLPQSAGGISYQTFTINAISETPIELRISNV